MDKKDWVKGLDAGTLRAIVNAWAKLRQKLAAGGKKEFSTDTIYELKLDKTLGVKTIIVKGIKYSSGNLIGVFLRTLQRRGLIRDTGRTIPSTRPVAKKHKIKVFEVV